MPSATDVSKGFCFAMTTYYSHIASIHSVFRCLFELCHYVIVIIYVPMILLRLYLLMYLEAFILHCIKATSGQQVADTYV